jgi:hypothetical protein
VGGAVVVADLFWVGTQLTGTDGAVIRGIREIAENIVLGLKREQVKCLQNITRTGTERWGSIGHELMMNCKNVIWNKVGMQITVGLS